MNFEDDTLLLLKSTPTECFYASPITGTIKQLQPKDTLLYDDANREEYVLNIHQKELKNIAFNPIMPRIEKKCPQCARAVVSYIVINHYNIIVYGCVCSHIWTDKK